MAINYPAGTEQNLPPGARCRSDQDTQKRDVQVCIKFYFSPATRNSKRKAPSTQNGTGSEQTKLLPSHNAKDFTFIRLFHWAKFLRSNKKHSHTHMRSFRKRRVNWKRPSIQNPIPGVPKCPPARTTTTRASQQFCLFPLLTVGINCN